jgi:hypothetical protein
VQAIVEYITSVVRKHAGNPLPLALAVGVLALAFAAVGSRQISWWQRLALIAVAIFGALAWWMM